MDIRTRLCFALSRRLIRPPASHVADPNSYNDWRTDELTKSWSVFDDSHVIGKEVMDFGCGDGPLSLFLAATRRPKRVVGVDLDAAGIERARQLLTTVSIEDGVSVEFLVSSTEQIPVPDRSFDTLLAIDCVEHLMEPAAVLSEWFRVLRPGGRCLIRWFPYTGPWGPHMAALVPIPWAHVLFGERAMFRTAALIYDLPEFVPRHWDIDAQGNRKPNKWRAWSTFEQQGHINKLRIRAFRTLASSAGFRIVRHQQCTFGGSLLRRVVGSMLMNTKMALENWTTT